MDLVAAAGLKDVPPMDTPMEINAKLRKDEGELLLDPTVFRTLMGSQIYLKILGLIFLCSSTGEPVYGIS
jgi:hypothetical protein